MATKLEPEEEAIILPWDAVKSRWTKEDYFRDSRWFLEFAGYADPKKIHHRAGPDHHAKQTREETVSGMYKMIKAAVKDPAKTKLEVLRFIRMLNERVVNKELGPSEVRKRVTPIKLALDLAEVPLSWKKIMRLLPKERRSRNREYHRDEIQKLLAVASLHLQIAILFMASSGIRVGAFEFLDVGHVKPMMVDGKVACGQVTVYAGEGDDEYQTLVSKEAYLKCQDYLETRRARGEKLTDQSPLLVTRRWEAGKERRYSVTGIRNDVTRLCWKSGLRKKHEKRFEVQACHGLRKYFNNIAKDYIYESYTEKLIGHDQGTREHYDRHLPKPAIEQYLRAMPFLSIDPAYRAEAELGQQLEAVQAEHGKDFTDLRLRFLEKGEELKTLQETSRKQEQTLKEVLTILDQIKTERERELRPS